ncbi:MAG: Fe-S cluster assembly ATPase SufC [Candidatus Ranarchaeia archaeon]
MKPLILIKNLKVNVNDTEILHDINLSFERGKVYAIIGPNGSGKSTIARTLMGFSQYKITSGDITFNGKSILKLSITDRARKGFGYAFQNPPMIRGIKLRDFVCKFCKRSCDRSKNLDAGNPVMCQESIVEGFERLNIKNLKDREVNNGFSGGETKRSELFQVISMNPRIMILDEPDSGLDYDSLKVVGKELKHIQETTNTTIIIITHHRFILEYLQADRIDILQKGYLVYTGSMKSLSHIEKLGYAKFLEHHGKRRKP